MPGGNTGLLTHGCVVEPLYCVGTAETVLISEVSSFQG